MKGHYSPVSCEQGCNWSWLGWEAAGSALQQTELLEQRLCFISAVFLNRTTECCSPTPLFRHSSGRIKCRQKRLGRQECVVSGLLMQGHLESSSK